MDAHRIAQRLRERLATPDSLLHAQVGELLQGLGDAAEQVWTAARPPGRSHQWLLEIEALAAALDAEGAENLAALLLPDAPLDECAAFWMGARATLRRDVFFLSCGRPQRPLSLPWCQLYGGIFRMGSRSLHTDSWERPVHTVSLSPFWMTRTPITKAQFALMDPRCQPGDIPVGEVSWLTAWLFAEWAGVALPTESQWEYACRAGSESPWSHGDQPEQLEAVAWYADNAGNQPQPVGQKHPNDWGMYDMHGNVMEWCRDQQRIYYAGALPQRDPGVALRPLRSAMFRVVRGGYYGSDADGCRSAKRATFDMLSAFNGLGFRLVSAAPPHHHPATAGEGVEDPEAP